MLRLLLTVALLVGPATFASAQVVDLTPPGETASPVMSAGDSHHEATLARVITAIDNSDYPQWKKNRMKRKLRRPAVALAVTDRVTSEALAAGVIQVPTPPAWAVMESLEEGTPLPAAGPMQIDLDSLLRFIEAIIPLIEMLIGLFGLTLIFRFGSVSWSDVVDRAHQFFYGNAA